MAVFRTRRYVILEQQGLSQLLTLVGVGMVSYVLLSVAFNMKFCKEIVGLYFR